MNTIGFYSESRIAYSRIQNFLMKDELEVEIPLHNVENPSLTLKNVSFENKMVNKKGKENVFEIKDINLELKKSSLNLVIGKKKFLKISFFT